MASRQEKFIRDLRYALIRIENKTYGVCRKTGKLISKKRLELVPHATLSIEAKKSQGKRWVLNKLFFFVFIFSLVFLDQSLKIWVFFNQDVLGFPGWWWENIPFFDIIYLENVKAFILLQNSESISIKSNYAKYNAKSFDTLFNDSVTNCLISIISSAPVLSNLCLL